MLAAAGSRDLRAEDVAQSAKCVPGKHQALSNRTGIEQKVNVMHVCNPSTGEMEIA